MATPVFHPCRFQFADQDIRRVGSTISGGSSLSGFDDPIETDGGGFWRADFANGETIEREDTLAWRAVTAAMDNGAASVIVEFCDRLHQPVGGEIGIAGSPDQFGDRRSFTGPGVVTTASEPAALRATLLAISIHSERELVGGERFTITHTNWGERAYEVLSVNGSAIRIRPPLREAITAGTVLDFENPRCRMKLPAGFSPSNALSLGRYGQCSISFVEDMRPPA